MESLSIWYALHKETAINNIILINDIKYFEALLRSKADDTNSPAEVKLLIAELDNTPLATMFLIISCNRASYLYAAFTGLMQNYMATYALQWVALKKVKGERIN